MGKARVDLIAERRKERSDLIAVAQFLNVIPPNLDV
jgi:hypothetical protein